MTSGGVVPDHAQGLRDAPRDAVGFTTHGIEYPADLFPIGEHVDRLQRPGDDWRDLRHPPRGDDSSSDSEDGDGGPGRGAAGTASNGRAQLSGKTLPGHATGTDQTQPGPAPSGSRANDRNEQDGQASHTADDAGSEPRSPGVERRPPVKLKLKRPLKAPLQDTTGTEGEAKTTSPNRKRRSDADGGRLEKLRKTSRPEKPGVA